MSDTMIPPPPKIASLAVDIKSLYKWFGTFQVLADINLQI